MASQRLTDEQVELLSASKHVRRATNHTVFFTADFKALFWQKLNEGKEPSEIFAEEGIDPQILGKTRIAGFRSTVLKEAKTGFTDYLGFTNSKTRFATPEARINFLEQQLAFKDQQIEFLKKIASLVPDEGNT